MMHHAKASSAGSTMRQASRLGRIVRGALATRASALRAKGSGAPSAAQAGFARPAVVLLLAVAVLAASLSIRAAIPMPAGTARAAGVAPTVATTAPTNVFTDQAQLNGSVNPNGELTKYWFEWGTTSSYGTRAPVLEVKQGETLAEAEAAYQGLRAGEGTEAATASKSIGGLQPATTYHFRIAAENASGRSLGQDESFETAPRPAPEACPNEAIRVEQHATYLPDCRAYELVSPTDKHGNDVMGLSSRVQASIGESPGLPAALAFSSLGVFAGAEGTGIATDYLSQRDGAPGTSGWSTHAITPSQQPLPYVAASLANEPLYVGDLSPDLSAGVFQSWSPLTADPYVSEVPDLYLRRDLRSAGPGSYALLSACPLCAETSTPLPPYRNFFQLLLKRPRFAAASPDYRHILFEDKADLTPDASAANVKLYLAEEGRVRLLSNGTGTCPGVPPVFELSPSAPCSAAAKGVTNTNRAPRAVSNDGSRIEFTAPLNLFGEGEAATSSPYQLDTNGTATTADDVVIKLNASEKSEPEAPQAAYYQIASTDGERVFFTSEEQLTASPGGGLYMWKRQNHNEVQRLTVDASGGSFTLTAHFGALEATTPPLAFDATAAQVRSALEALSGPQLSGQVEPQRLFGEGNVSVSGGPGGAAPYAIEFTGALAGVDVPLLAADGSSLSGGASTATPEIVEPVHDLQLISGGFYPGSIDGVIGASEDGRRLYFASNGFGSLVPGGPYGEGDQIYLWQEAGAGESLFYVGRTTGQGIRVVLNEHMALVPDEGFVSSDGRSLAFTSTSGKWNAPQYEHFETNDPSTSSCGFACRELYVYSLDGSTPTEPDLLCASCDLAAPRSPGVTKVDNVVGQGLSQGRIRQGHVLSEDGRYAFFSTDEALVPQDTNGVSDAYEYDTHNGAYHLLSSGTSEFPSYFEEMSADGKNAYILTRQRLLGWDNDGAYDVYDVRVDGGFPEPPPPPHAPCEGESCHGSEAPPPPASIGSGLEGAGNPKPPRCRNGKHQLTRHGHTRCVARHHHKHHRRTHNNRRAGQ